MVALQRGPIYAVQTFSDLINLSLLRKQQRSTNPGEAVQYFTQHWSLIPSVPSLQSEIFVFKPVHLPDLSLWEDSCCFLPVSATCSHGLTSLTYLQIHKQTWKRNRWSQRIWAVTLGNQNEPLLSDSLDMSRWGLALSELCRMRAAFSSLGTSAQTSRSAWVLPAQHFGTGKHLARFKAEQGARGFIRTDSDVTPSARNQRNEQFYSTALRPCPNKCSLCGKNKWGGTGPDALQQERTFQWSSHILQMFKVLHQNSRKKKHSDLR